MKEFFEESRGLWGECLPEESDGFMEFYYGVKVTENWIQGDFVDGNLVSMVHWNPYRMMVKDRVWDTRYVIAVATKAEFRRQGRMARLLTEGMRKYAVEGMPFVWLMPIALGIYEPFDFRFVYERVEGEWPEVDGDCRKNCVEVDFVAGSESVSDLERTGSGGEEFWVRPLRVDEYGAAAEFLNRELAARYEVFTWRSEEWLRVVAAEVASEDGRIWGVFDEDGLAGVFHEWRGETVEIRELVCKARYEKGDGAQQLIRGIREVLEADLGIAERGAARITAVTTGWLGEPKPMIMARILNLREMVKVVSADQPKSLRIRIRDNYLPENDGIFRWEVTEDGSWLEPVSEVEATELAASPELLDGDLGIADFTEWIFGRREWPGFEGIRQLKGVFLNEIV